jgi:DNA mismatch repair protein MutH
MPAQFDHRSTAGKLNLHYRPPPTSEDELLARAAMAAGRELHWLAKTLAIDVPPDLLGNKGWAGLLLEAWLGASAASLPEPDFPELGIELKTLPVDAAGKPLESTYICAVPLAGTGGDWKQSGVYRKLSRVLWIPLLSVRGQNPGERRIGHALLWRPDADQMTALQADWEELMELICTGDLDRVSARQGQYLQIRPKAANARALTQGFDSNGEVTRTLPRGFYLRTRFTREILKKHYHA